MLIIHSRHSVRAKRGLVTALHFLTTTLVSSMLAVSPAAAAVSGHGNGPSSTLPHLAIVEGEGSGSLESAASKAGEAGRKIAMSMIALGFSIASIVLAFRRDFKEAAGIFAIGIVAILLATPAGENVLHATVNSLFGAS